MLRGTSCEVVVPAARTYDVCRNAADDTVVVMVAKKEQRVAAYAVVVEDERVLLVLAGVASSGRWFLPGGGIEFGEDPEDAVRREVLEETGQEVEGLALCSVLSDSGPVEGRELHSVRIIYRAAVRGGRDLRHEANGSTVQAKWVPLAEVMGLQLAPFVRECLTGLAP